MAGPLIPPFVWIVFGLAGCLLALAPLRHPLAVWALVLGVTCLFGAHSARNTQAELRSLERLRGPPRGPHRLSGTLVLERGARGRAAWLESGDVRLRLSGPALGDLLPGVGLTLVGTFSAPRRPRDPGAFDPAHRLARQGVSRCFRAAHLERVHGRRSLSALGGGVRRCVRELIERSVSSRQRPLFRAVLLGERQRFPAGVREAFSATGAAHLLSISGLHVSLFAGLLLLLLRGLGLSAAEQRVAVVLFLLAYLVLIGPRAPTLRATTVGAVFFLAPARGDPWNRLALALLAVLGWDPLAWREVGLILSFGTVAGMLALGPPLFGLLGEAPPWERALPERARRIRRAGRRALVAALLAFLASTPLLALQFGELPLAALVVGPPAIALFTVLLGLATLGVLIGVVAPPLGSLLLAGAGGIADLLVAFVQSAAAVCPAVTVTRPAPACALIAVGSFAVGALRRERGRPARALLLLGLLLALAAVLPRPGVAQQPKLIARQRGRVGLLRTPAGVALGLGRERPARRWLVRAREELGCRRLRWVGDDPSLRGARTIRRPGWVRVTHPAGRVRWRLPRPRRRAGGS